MPLTLTPNVEKIVADFLRDQADITAITGGRRASYETPKDTDTPWIRYTLLSSPAVGGHRADYLVAPYFQFECYAGREGGQPEANLLARTVRAALTALGRGEATVSGATVTGVEIRGFTSQPDVQLDNRARYIVSAVIWIHG